MTLCSSCGSCSPYWVTLPLGRGWSTVVFLVTFAAGSLLPVVVAVPHTEWFPLDSGWNTAVVFLVMFAAGSLLPVVVAVPHTKWFSLDSGWSPAVIFLVTFVVDSVLPVVNTEPLTGSLFLWILDRGWNTAVVFLVICSWQPASCCGCWTPYWRGCPFGPGVHILFSLSWCFQLAFRYLSWALYPLLACYAVYSLVYQEHRGWYSWVLNMLYGFLLTFGKEDWSSCKSVFLSLTVLWLREQRKWEEKLTVLVFVVIEPVA